ncbi:ureidoglycolate hydrolase [Coniosporium apollinis CBS 100218]|uniref:Ureidoglycolate hydrolase n=1 Tax=Coniosporium apollinis (strain CBS 100218) TaxID=1168221 RepID=R7Z4I1_CONA1|nr:ureidoglycolate hydrolase [Coniosporium apollinis CBS 100218]EON68924.1 ureidoglycolate hydrolase [Coniosporium apollinis CBS 100218]
MPSPVTAPSIRISAEPLTQASFAQFGTVVENPTRSHSPVSHHPQAVAANQGTAVKYLDVTHVTNFYNLAPSKKPAEAVVNMFICSPRKLRSVEPATSKSASQSNTDQADQADQAGKHLFDVNILERHPYTSQTFIPLGLSPQDKTTQYLVIVAPTLPTSKTPKDLNRLMAYPLREPRRRRSLLDVFAKARPSPFTNEASPPIPDATQDPSQQNRKGPGLPDLNNIKAFVATGNQAVTYGAGTWHAPMVVIGEGSVDFVVLQYANGVGQEDCQEVELHATEGDGISVALQTPLAPSFQVRSKL